MNLLKPELYVGELPWGNTLGNHFCIASERNVRWFPGGVAFDVAHEQTEGWYMAPGWVRTPVTADYGFGWIVSKDQYGPGIYNMKCRLPNFRGSFPSWWFYDVLSPDEGGIQCEIDVFEHFRKDSFLTRFKTTQTYHDKGVMHKCKARWQFPPVDFDDMTFQFIWQENRIAWVVNGKQVMEVFKDDVNQFPTKPMNIIIGSGLGDWNVQQERLSPFIVHELTKI
ncbi:MAG: family 16 glycosylhydrolase [Bacteroidales bacterium]